MITVITPIIKTKRYNNRYRRSKASWQFPKGAENSYLVLMDNLLGAMKKSIDEYLPRLKQQIDASPFIIKNDDISGDMDELRRILAQYADNPLLDRRVKDIADAIYRNDQNQLEKAFRSAMQVDIYASFPELSEMTDLWVKSNIGLIKTVPDVYAGNLSSVITNGVQQGRTYADMAEDIQKAYNTTYNRALFWARDQTAKLNGNITRHMQTQAGADKYEWSTSRDVRVRATHADREGHIYNWTGTENRPDGLDPGEEYNCRCVALPVFDLMKVQENVAGMDNIIYPKDSKDSAMVDAEKLARLEEHIKNNWGTDYVDLSGLDYDMVSGGISNIEYFANKNKEFDLLKNITSVNKSSNGVMSFGPTVSGEIVSKTNLHFNPKYYGRRKQAYFDNVVKKQIEAKHWVKNTTAQSIIIHEAGHIIDLQKSLQMLAEWRDDLRIITSPTMKDLRDIGWSSNGPGTIYANDIVKRALTQYNKRNSMSGFTIKDLRMSISRYADENNSECLAEALHDVFVNGEQAAEASKIIVDLLEVNI